MEPQHRPTPPLLPPIPIDVSPQASPSTAPVVAVVFQEHRYDHGVPKPWSCAPLAPLEDVSGR